MSLRRNNQHHAVSLKQRFFSLPTVLSFGVAITFIYFLATRFDLEWGKTWDNVRGMDLLLYLLAFGLYYTSFGFRGLRWRLLARNAGIDELPGTRLPSALRFSQMVIIGWFVNSVTPLRLGDAYRAYAFSEDSKGSFSWSLGTVLAERVMDMATVLFLIVIGVAWFSATRDSGGVVYIAGAALVMALALGALLAIMKGYGIRLARLLPGRFEGAYHRFHRGALGSLRQLPVLFLLGLIGWLLEAGRLYFTVQALELSITIPLVLVVALGHAVLSTVPTPGGVGAVEPGVTGLLVLGLELERHDAVSVVLVDRSITYLSVIVVGGLVFFLWQLARARSRDAAPRVSEGVAQSQGAAET